MFTNFFFFLEKYLLGCCLNGAKINLLLFKVFVEASLATIWVHFSGPNHSINYSLVCSNWLSGLVNVMKFRKGISVIEFLFLIVSSYLLVVDEWLRYLDNILGCNFF